MNRAPDVELVLRDWLADDGDIAPDRILDVVADRIAQHPRRRIWRLQGRLSVNIQIKLIAGLAAALVVAVVGYNVLPKQASNVGAPTVTPTHAPSPTAAGIRVVTDTAGILDPGRWRFHPIESNAAVSVVAVIPAGWRASGQSWMEDAVATNSAPAGIAVLFGTSDQGLFSDPCHWDLDGSGTWDQEGDVKVGPTVADLTDALQANSSYSSSTPSPVAFGAYKGQEIELRLPAGLDPADCDQNSGEVEGRYRIMPEAIYAQGPGNIWRLFIVDLAGTRVITTIEYFPGTAPDALAEALAIVDSFEFTP